MTKTSNFSTNADFRYSNALLAPGTAPLAAGSLLKQAKKKRGKTHTHSGFRFAFAVAS